MWCAHSGAESSRPKKRRKRKHQETETPRAGHHDVKEEHRALFYMHGAKIITYRVYDSAYLSCVSCCVSVHAWASKLCQGIDLATPFSQRDTTDDLDHIMMDAMLEGFDTGVSCLSLPCMSFIAKRIEVDLRLIQQGMLLKWGSCFRNCVRHMEALPLASRMLKPPCECVACAAKPMQFMHKHASHACMREVQVIYFAR